MKCDWLPMFPALFLDCGKLVAENIGDPPHPSLDEHKYLVRPHSLQQLITQIPQSKHSSQLTIKQVPTSSNSSSSPKLSNHHPINNPQHIFRTTSSSPELSNHHPITNPQHIFPTTSHLHNGIIQQQRQQQQRQQQRQQQQQHQ